MTTGTHVVTTETLLTSTELELIADAIGVLYFRNPDRRQEIIAFAKAHPELYLLHQGEEPAADEDREGDQ